MGTDNSIESTKRQKFQISFFYDADNNDEIHLAQCNLRRKEIHNNWIFTLSYALFKVLNTLDGENLLQICGR